MDDVKGKGDVNVKQTYFFKNMIKYETNKLKTKHILFL